MTAPITLETIFTTHGKIPASPLQLAITRAAEGRSLRRVLSPDELALHFGVESSAPLRTVPALVVLVCGVRSGKSFLSACAAIRGALVADCSGLQPHEVPRVPIVAPNADNASATFTILCGIVDGSALAALVVSRTSESLTLRRPDGRKVEIVVVAASRGGITFRSRWLAGFILEEVAFFPPEADGFVVNAEALLRAGETRLLPRAQGWIVSSPNGAAGLLFDLHEAHFGKPGRVLVVTAPTRAMNPSFPEETIEAVRARDADAAAREYDAQWVASASALLDAATVDACRRRDWPQLPYTPHASYTAAIDPATRGNAFTLILLESSVGVHRVALAKQWQGSKRAPLSPRAVFFEVAAALKSYRVTRILCDQWSIDANRDLAREAGLTIAERTQTAPRKFDDYESMRMLLVERRLELPPDSTLRADLLSLRKVVTHAGPRIEAPRQPGGRHADYASSLALAVSQVKTIRGPRVIDLAPEETRARELAERRAANPVAQLRLKEDGRVVLVMPQAPRRNTAY